MRARGGAHAVSDPEVERRTHGDREPVHQPIGRRRVRGADDELPEVDERDSDGADIASHAAVEEEGEVR